MVRETNDGLSCGDRRHANIFNLDHNPDGELPMFCRCGEMDFNDEELDINYQHEARWLRLIQDVT